jgi:hypothetical protein
MDVAAIKEIMLQKGIADDPAWQTVNFAIRPIPCLSRNDCPLGLYFPVAERVPKLGGVVPARTIIIPPNSTEGVLLHELGHHHGNFYYQDVSEEYARAYRQVHQGDGLPYTVAACGSEDCCHKCSCQHVKFTRNDVSPQEVQEVSWTHCIPWLWIGVVGVTSFAIVRQAEKKKVGKR